MSGNFWLPGCAAASAPLPSVISAANRGDQGLELEAAGGCSPRWILQPHPPTAPAPLHQSSSPLQPPGPWPASPQQVGPWGPVAQPSCTIDQSSRQGDYAKKVYFHRYKSRNIETLIAQITENTCYLAVWWRCIARLHKQTVQPSHTGSTP